MTDDKILFVRSSKKNGGKSTGGDSSTNEDDIWDDSLLIKAYDRAVQSAQESYLKKKQHPENEVKSKVKKTGKEQKWKVGDKCRCQYSEDHKYYEADIIEIVHSAGTCVVKYVGYENEEEIPLKQLKPSEGDSARAKQCKEATEANEYQSNAEVENDTVSSSGKKSQPAQKKSSKKGYFKKRNGFSKYNSFNSMNFPLPQMENLIIPPPPPHMFNGLTEDENETDAMSAMLISWYMSGYHTGYYQGLKMGKKQQ